MPYKDPEKHREAVRRYQERNAEKVRASKKVSNRRWKEANAARVAAYNSAYYEANRDRLIEYSKQWMARNPTYRETYWQAYKASNEERIRARTREYQPIANAHKRRRYYADCREIALAASGGAQGLS
jgi:ABC-type uncharacterized transport system involved in gliding motility auxiliary subunit